MKITTHSAQQTQRLAKRISRYLQKGDIVCLFGELGSGKTIFTKGLAAGLGIAPRQIISPTFVLLREYIGKSITLYHFDFYRLHGPEDIVPLGYEEYFYNAGLTVVEWPQRLKKLLPKEYLAVKLKVIGPLSRSVQLEGCGGKYINLLKKISREHENNRF